MRALDEGATRRFIAAVDRRLDQQRSHREALLARQRELRRLDSATAATTSGADVIVEEEEPEEQMPQTAAAAATIAEEPSEQPGSSHAPGETPQQRHSPKQRRHTTSKRAAAARRALERGTSSSMVVEAVESTAGPTEPGDEFVDVEETDTSAVSDTSVEESPFASPEAEEQAPAPAVAPAQEFQLVTTEATATAQSSGTEPASTLG